MASLKGIMLKYKTYPLKEFDTMNSVADIFSYVEDVIKVSEDNNEPIDAQKDFAIEFLLSGETKKPTKKTEEKKESKTKDDVKE